MLYALWAYVKAKGCSGAWVLMAFLNVLIVLVLLKDRCKDGTAPASRGPNEVSQRLGWRFMSGAIVWILLAVGASSQNATLARESRFPLSRYFRSSPRSTVRMWTLGRSSPMARAAN